MELLWVGQDSDWSDCLFSESWAIMVSQWLDVSVSRVQQLLQFSIDSV